MTPDWMGSGLFKILFSEQLRAFRLLMGCLASAQFNDTFLCQGTKNKIMVSWFKSKEVGQKNTRAPWWKLKTTPLIAVLLNQYLPHLRKSYTLQRDNSSCIERPELLYIRHCMRCLLKDRSLKWVTWDAVVSWENCFLYGKEKKLNIDVNGLY